MASPYGSLGHGRANYSSNDIMREMQHSGYVQRAPNQMSQQPTSQFDYSGMRQPESYPPNWAKQDGGFGASGEASTMVPPTSYNPSGRNFSVPQQAAPGGDAYAGYDPSAFAGLPPELLEGASRVDVREGRVVSNRVVETQQQVIAALPKDMFHYRENAEREAAEIEAAHAAEEAAMYGGGGPGGGPGGQQPGYAGYGQPGAAGDWNEPGGPGGFVEGAGGFGPGGGRPGGGAAGGPGGGPGVAHGGVHGGFGGGGGAAGCGGSGSYPGSGPGFGPCGQPGGPCGPGGGGGPGGACYGGPGGPGAGVDPAAWEAAAQRRAAAKNAALRDAAAKEEAAKNAVRSVMDRVAEDGNVAVHGVRPIYMMEKVVEVPHVITKETEKHVPKPEIIERLIEVAKTEVREKVHQLPPQVQYQEQIIEVPEVVVEERIIHVPKREVQERLIEVPKVRYVERIEYEDIIEYREVPVDRVVEVPEIEYRIREVEQLVPQTYVQEYYVDRYKEVPVTQVQEVERIEHVPVVVPPGYTGPQQAQYQPSYPAAAGTMPAAAAEVAPWTGPAASGADFASRAAGPMAASFGAAQTQQQQHQQLQHQQLQHQQQQQQQLQLQQQASAWAPMSMAAPPMTTAGPPTPPMPLLGSAHAVSAAPTTVAQASAALASMRAPQPPPGGAAAFAGQWAPAPGGGAPPAAAVTPASLASLPVGSQVVVPRGTVQPSRGVGLPSQVITTPSGSAAIPAAGRNPFESIPGTQYQSQMQSAMAPPSGVYQASRQQTMFDALDSNHDGVLSREEFNNRAAIAASA